MKSVAKLIADAPGIAYYLVYVSMRVTIYPVVDTTVCYIVAKLHCKGSVDRTSFELIRHKLIRRHMMGSENMKSETTLCLYASNRGWKS